MPLFAIFETPLLVGAVAAGAASIPIVIHLLNRRRFRIVQWAAMRFLLAAQKKNTRRMRLEQLLLLAVAHTPCPFAGSGHGQRDALVRIALV